MRRGGYTILELLTVCGIISILLGIGVGVFAKVGKRNELEATTNSVRSVIRRARNAAREERAPAVVEIDEKTGEVRAATRETLVLFRFEAEQCFLDQGMVVRPASSGARGGGGMELTPEDAPAPRGGGAKPPPEGMRVQGSFGISGWATGVAPTDGRIGMGFDFAQPGAAMAVPDRPALNPLEGVALEAWILPARLEDLIPQKAGERPRLLDLERRIAEAGAPPTPTPPRALAWWSKHPDDPPLFTIARKGKAFEVALTGGYALQLSVTGPQGGGEVTHVARTEDLAVRPDKWARVQLVFDGQRLSCWVDGMMHVLVPVKGFEAMPERLARDRSPLLVSDPDPDRSFAGTIDELKLQGVLRSERVRVPKNLALLAPTTEIAFDALGQLDPLRHPEPVVLWLSDAEEALVALEPPAIPAPRTVARKAEPPDPAARGLPDPEKARRFAALVRGLRDKLGENRVREVGVELTGSVH